MPTFPFLLVNKNSTKARDSPTNPSDAQNADRPRRLKPTVAADVVVVEAEATVVAETRATRSKRAAVTAETRVVSVTMAVVVAEAVVAQTGLAAVTVVELVVAVDASSAERRATSRLIAHQEVVVVAAAVEAVVDGVEAVVVAVDQAEAGVDRATPLPQETALVVMAAAFPTKSFPLFVPCFSLSFFSSVVII